jgi:hypothetical protein
MLALHGGGTRTGLRELEVAPNLWAGIGLVRGGAGTALVGSHREVADRIAEYAAMGVTEFVLSGYPHLEEAYWFGEGVLPLLAERGLWTPPQPAPRRRRRRRAGRPLRPDVTRKGEPMTATRPRTHDHADDSTPAHVINSDGEALEVARQLSAEFAVNASRRDAERLLPYAEVDRLSASGLLAITVPAEHGGADVSTTTLTEVLRLLAVGDPNLAQIPQSHFVYVNVLRRQGTPDQQRFFFGEILAGKRLGNAQSEAGTKHVQDIRTRLTPVPGGYLLDGLKNYSTGALFAHWVPVLARTPDDKLHVAYVPADAPGLTVIDD